MNELEVENVGSAKYYISATSWLYARKLVGLTFLSMYVTDSRLL